MLKLFKSISNYKYSKLLEKNEINVDCHKEDKKEFIKNRLVSKTQQRFKSERHNVCSEEINKIALSLNNDKRINYFNSNICTWNKQRSYMEERKS